MAGHELVNKFLIVRSWPPPPRSHWLNVHEQKRIGPIRPRPYECNKSPIVPGAPRPAPSSLMATRFPTSPLPLAIGWRLSSYQPMRRRDGDIS